MAPRFESEHDPNNSAPAVGEYPRQFATLEDPLCGPSGADTKPARAMATGDSEEYGE